MMKRPNLLIIQTDQQSTWTMGCYGGTLIDTPNIDLIAKEGVRFDNFFTPCAVCTPSRGCFITGRYPHAHGAYSNFIPINRDEVTLAHILRDSGYETGYAGKWHLNGAEDPGWIEQDTSMGFDDCRYMFNCGHFKEVIEKENSRPEATYNIGNKKTYTTDWLADKTVDYIKQERKRPFFFMLSIPDPHQPYNVRSPYDSMYHPEDMLIPKSFYQQEIPDWADQDEWGRKRYFPINLENRENILKNIKAQYCGEVKCIDDNVGKIINCLKEQEILDNTILVFTADHGEYMGEHGLLEKNNLYDSVYRIPLIIRWPEQIFQGKIITEFVNIIDFQPTLLSLMNIAACGREQGRDAACLLRGKKIPWDNEVFIHPNGPPRAGIITPEYELAIVDRGWNKEEGHTFYDHILFDRVADPDQLHNLFFEKQYENVVKELKGRIIQHFIKINLPKELLPKALFD